MRKYGFFLHQEKIQQLKEKLITIDDQEISIDDFKLNIEDVLEQIFYIESNSQFDENLFNEFIEILSNINNSNLSVPDSLNNNNFIDNREKNLEL